MNTYTQLTPAQRLKLPRTYGHPVNAVYVARHEDTMWKHGNTYDLDFDSVTQELTVALDIGLENYGSGRASFEECRILRTNNTANKEAQLWKLYVSQVCGDYSSTQVNNAWGNYTEEQQDYITAKMEQYLEWRLEYTLESFGINL